MVTKERRTPSGAHISLPDPVGRPAPPLLATQIEFENRKLVSRGAQNFFDGFFDAVERWLTPCRELVPLGRAGHEAKLKTGRARAGIRPTRPPGDIQLPGSPQAFVPRDPRSKRTPKSRDQSIRLRAASSRDWPACRSSTGSLKPRQQQTLGGISMSSDRLWTARAPDVARRDVLKTMTAAGSRRACRVGRRWRRRSRRASPCSPRRWRATRPA